MQVLLMESAAKVRRLVFQDGRSIRAVSRETGLSRNKFRKYVQTASPPSYQWKMPPVRHKLSGFETRLQEWYDLDQEHLKASSSTPQWLR